MFAPSEVSWPVKGVPVKLIQSTNYPQEEEVEIRIETPKPVDFAVNVRIPGWLESRPTLTVNGKPFVGPAQNGTFASIRRRWKSGDTIHLRLPLTFRTEPIDDRHPNLVAVMRGPPMMVVLDPPEDLHSTPLELPGKLQFKPFYSVRDETYNTYFTRKV